MHASPVKAQQIIEEPGYCAQFYSDAKCQNMARTPEIIGRIGKRVMLRLVAIRGATGNTCTLSEIKKGGPN